MEEQVESVAAAGEAYLRAFARMYPRERSAYGFWPFGAAYMGIHDDDGALTDYSPASVAARVRELDGWGPALDAVAPRALSRDDRIDLATLRWVREAELFALREIQPHRRRPMHYNDTLNVSLYLRRSYAPFEDRLRALLRHLRAIPDALATARANLDFALPISEVDLRQAVQGFRGHIYYLQKDLLSAIQPCADRALVADIEAAAETAIGAIADLVDYLRANEGRASGSAAIGQQQFLGLLRTFDLIDIPLDQLRAAGEGDLARNRAMLEETARRIDSAASVREVSDRLRDDHPAWDELLPAARDVLAGLKAHIVARDLVSLPSPVEPIVAETLPFHRWGFASMDSPGAFEPHDSNAYYYVTSPDADWPSNQKEQWMRRFYDASIATTSAHEAYPGHYVQSMHKRLAPTAVQKAFDCFTHWEAWAHYCEQMILDEGYGDGDPRLRMAQLQDALLRNARYLVAIGIHCDGMSVDDATRFIMDATLMDELPARKEAERGTYDPAYGNYCLGKLMLLKLRADVRREQGATFSLRAFHDDFLGHGAPPFPIVRARMLREDDGRLV